MEGKRGYDDYLDKYIAPDEAKLASLNELLKSKINLAYKRQPNARNSHLTKLHLTVDREKLRHEESRDQVVSIFRRRYAYIQRGTIVIGNNPEQDVDTFVTSWTHASQRMIEDRYHMVLDEHNGQIIKVAKLTVEINEHDEPITFTEIEGNDPEENWASVAHTRYVPEGVFIKGLLGYSEVDNLMQIMEASTPDILS